MLINFVICYKKVMVKINFEGTKLLDIYKIFN